TKIYARRRGLNIPLEYAERDFVVLAALGIRREGTAIELAETKEGRAFRDRLAERLGNERERPVLGLNIGCGTEDAIPKRPDQGLLSELAAELQRRHRFSLVLTGAPYEKVVIQEFLSRFKPGGPVVNLAGNTNLLELTGAIATCCLFISS